MDNLLIGKTITAIYLSTDREAIRFDTEDGEIIAYAEGDCCSHSWIEGLDFPESIIGSPVLSVEEVPMPDLGDMEGCDCVAYYGCRIATDKGALTIDYRNDSNGYYGGYLVWPGGRGLQYDVLTRVRTIDFDMNQWERVA